MLFRSQIIYDELLEIQRKFGDPRRTELQVGDITDIEDEDLIEEEDIVVIYYMKACIACETSKNAGCDNAADISKSSIHVSVYHFQKNQKFLHPLLLYLLFQEDKHVPFLHGSYPISRPPNEFHLQ